MYVQLSIMSRFTALEDVEIAEVTTIFVTHARFKCGGIGTVGAEDGDILVCCLRLSWM